MFPVCFLCVSCFFEEIKKCSRPSDTLLKNISFPFLLVLFVFFVVSFVLFFSLFFSFFHFVCLFISRMKTGEIVIVAVCDIRNDDLLLLADPAQHNAQMNQQEKK